MCQNPIHSPQVFQCQYHALQLEITFENIDYVVIPIHYFSDFCIEDIRTNTHCVAMNTIIRCQTASSVIFTLKKMVNDDFKNFVSDIHTVQYCGDTLFQRISNYRDISHIKLIYDGDSFDEFSVEWEDDGDREDRNKLQHSSMTEDENLCVYISKNQTNEVCI